MTLPLSEREVDVIRGKMLADADTAEELRTFLRFVSALEGLLDEADRDGYFGTEGWRHRIGWDAYLRPSRVRQGHLCGREGDRG